MIVDYDQPSVGAHMYVALDQVDTGIDCGPERAERVLRMVGGVTSVSAQKWAAGLASAVIKLANGLTQWEVVSVL